MTETQNADTSIYARAQVVNSLDACTFYHTMALPEHGVVEGQWDLRANPQRYLGNVRFGGKRVLDVGTANGFFCFHMEQQGADVVGYDLSPQYEVDVVPYADVTVSERIDSFQQQTQKVNNAFWLAHRLYDSKARLVHGSAYAIPAEIGRTQIAVFGAILLHLRDPFLALQQAARLTTETLIVVEPLWTRKRLWQARLLRGRWGQEAVFFRPNLQNRLIASWWHVSPTATRAFLKVLGFGKSRMTLHHALHVPNGKRVPYYTIVAQRTQSL